MCSGNSFPSLQAVIIAYSVPPAASSGGGSTPGALLKFAVPPAYDKVAIEPLFAQVDMKAFMSMAPVNSLENVACASS